MKDFIVLIAASGSGGHIFPALQIARAFERVVAPKINGELKVQFIGSGRPLEKKLIDENGFVRHEIHMVGVKHRGLKGSMQFLAFLPRAAWAVWRLLTQARPHVVIGVGGYASVLPVMLARLRGIPAWIHEAELRPGMANYFLSFFASRISVGFKQAVMPFASKVVYTGHPLRDGLKEIRQQEPPLEPPQRILVLGGSQGAQALDETVIGLAEFLCSRRLEIWHQTRPENAERAAAAYRQAGAAARVDGFIDDMPSAYAWADIIISRAGAGTVMEIGVVNKPAIFVPYPFAQGGHQKANALTLVQAGKALLVEEGAGFEERLKEALISLLDLSFYSAMRAASYEERSLTAAEEITLGCYELSCKKKGGKE